MEFKEDIYNISLNQYVILKKRYPTSNILTYSNRLILVKAICYIKANHIDDDNRYIKVDALNCILHGIEEISISNNLSLIENYFDSYNDPVMNCFFLSSILSYHVLIPEEYPLFAGYYWLSNDFKNEAFGV